MTPPDADSLDGLDTFAPLGHDSGPVDRLSVPIDSRLSEAKANLATILEALGKHPELREEHTQLQEAIAKLGVRHALHSHAEQTLQDSGTPPNSQLQREAAHIQSSTEELEADIEYLREQLDTLQNPTKYERRTSELKSLLSQIGNPPTLNQDFQQAYTTFVRDYGVDTAAKHNLEQNLSVLQHNAEVLTKNGEHLMAQRDHVAGLLEKPVSGRNAQRLHNHLKGLVAHFERHQQDAQAFNASSKNYVDFIDSLRENKEAAKQERSYVNSTKTQLLQTLNSVIAEDFDGSSLQREFAKARETLDPRTLEERGITRNFEVLQHNLSNVEHALHSVRSFAEQLRDDLQKADHRGWVDARKQNVADVETRFGEFQTMRDNYLTQLEQFLGDIHGQQAIQAKAPISEQRDRLTAKLASNPPIQIPSTALEDERSQWSSLGQSEQAEAAELGKEAGRLDASIKLLEQQMQGLQNKIESATTKEDLSALQSDVQEFGALVKRHNSEVRTLNRLSARLLAKLPANTDSVTQAAPRELTKNGKVLLKRVSNSQSPLQDSLRITGLNYSDGRSIKFSTEDRIAVWDSLLKDNPTLDLDSPGRQGNTLLHQIVLSAGIPAGDKAEMITFLTQAGAQINLKNDDGLPPLELSLRLANIETEVVDALKTQGGQLSLSERIPILAHLIGAGGEVSLKSGGHIEPVALEGLSPTFASFGLDPAFVESLDELQDRTTGPMKELYQRTERAWVNTTSYDKFIGRVRDAKMGIDTQDGVPEVLSTGWNHPSGHAISFVFNHEPDGYYFYACNTGDVKDPERSIVKYQVSDFNAFLRFLKNASHDSDQTRSLYVGRPERYGLDRLPDDKQLPSAIDKSSQKIGNCTVASRKAALLAMMWSENRDFNIPPKDLKAGYKEVTTELRERGVRGAIDSGHMGLMGKALVKMLTKFDRPACQGYAYEVASAMVRHSKGEPVTPEGGHPIDIPNVETPEFEAMLREAVKLGNLDLQQRERNGQTLAAYAEAQGKTEASSILRRLAS